jgi:hypothetical protein
MLLRGRYGILSMTVLPSGMVGAGRYFVLHSEAHMANRGKEASCFVQTHYY